jgi:signal transduction histidine kinase
VEWLRDLFETNRIIVLSVYGQVFFIMGLAIALQSRKRSELALARPLPWLAAFGIVHGFVEWGYLFVPIQSGFLPPPIIHGLLWAQLALKGISFALLLQCGAELLLSARAAAPGTGIATSGAPSTGQTAIGPFGQPWLRLAPSMALVLWAVGTGAISIALHPDFTPNIHPWLAAGQIDRAIAMVGAPLAIGDVLARYMLALPGSALVVIGLWRNAAALGPLAGPPVGTALRLATVAFGIYAVLGGLIGMDAPFPPASVINSTVVRDAFGIPIEVLRSVTGLVIAVAVIRVLDLFEQETDRALADARRNALLLRERERIGRDLHDGIIQSIYAVGLHVEEASAALGQTSGQISGHTTGQISGHTTGQPKGQADDQVQPRLQTVMSELNRITGDIRSYIFDLRSADLESRDAEEIFATVAEELRANTLIDLDLRVEGDYRPKLTGEQAEQLRHIAQEAFSNVLRHARAKRVEVTLRCTRRQFTVEIQDDGVGYDPEAAPARSRRGGAQGLANIRRRAEILGARLSMRSQPGQGSALSLTMPVTATRRSA